MTSPNLEEIASQLAAVLGGDGDDYALIGGLAVGAHGFVRATGDIEFVVRDLARAGSRLQQHGIRVERLRGDFSCLRGTIETVRFEVLPPLVPILWDRTIDVDLGDGSTLRVVDLDSLIRLKLKAAGPKDLMDVAALAHPHPDIRERAREQAVAYRIIDKLDAWLQDPRLQAELVEQEASDRPRRLRESSPKATRTRSRS
jgi:hypothetical protein